MDKKKPRRRLSDRNPRAPAARGPRPLPAFDQRGLNAFFGYNGGFIRWHGQHDDEIVGDA